MNAPEHPMLPHLVDLESNYTSGDERSYEVADLLRYALTSTEYWASLAVGWIEQGAPAVAVLDEVAALEQSKGFSQSLRHRSKRLLKHHPSQ